MMLMLSSKSEKQKRNIYVLFGFLKVPRGMSLTAFFRIRNFLLTDEKASYFSISQRTFVVHKLMNGLCTV